MTETDKLANVPGTVRIADREFTVASLPQRSERALYLEMDQVANEQQDAWQRAQPVLDRLEREKKFSDRHSLIVAISASVIRGDYSGDDFLERSRRTQPRVLARELYRRAKPFHSDLKLEEVEAIVTTANVGDLYYQMIEALAGSDPKESR